MTPTDSLLYTAAITPFTADGDLDVARLDSYHQWLADAGVDGVFSCGTTGEFIAMDDAERLAVISSALKVFGPERVIAHIGAPTLRQGIALAQAARHAGATRFAAMTPWFEPAQSASLLAYYAGLSEVTGGGLYAYHFPARTTATLTPQQLREITAQAGLVGVKVSGLPADALLEYLDPQRPDFEVFTGNDASFIACAQGGAVGAVSGLSSAFPSVYVAAREALRSGDAGRIQTAQQAVEVTVRAVEGGNFALVKQALAMQGHPVGPCRVGLDDPNLAQTAALQQALAELGLTN